MKDIYIEQDSIVKNNISYAAIELPVYLWRVTIPKNGDFQIAYTIDLTKWQRLWMKFIGWGVEDLQTESRSKADECINI